MWPIPEITRVIHCGKSFGIFRTWTGTCSQDEREACYLGRKGHRNRMPKKISALIRGSVSSIPQIMRVIPCRQIFGIFRAWSMVSPHEELVACSLGPKGHGHRMPKNISAQIGGSVWPIPEIMRVICCRQIFSICRAWTRTSSHNEHVACYLGRKGHGHRMPEKHFCTNRGQCVTNTWKYESDLLQSDFWHIQSLDKDVFAWWTSNLQIIAKGHGRRMA